MMKSLPNILTFSRIVTIPALIGAFYLEPPLGNWLAFTLFTLAGLTDFFDGYMARAMGVTSRLGQFMDPIADKLMVAATIL
ncbi:MAG: CDP-alcohol phosphatidyltransferase family protein, partial [Sphingomonadales bacterium]|nr:CDP-alcohol phosphatidyltransferase family protein [Sphingomonadales bacterium]